MALYLFMRKLKNSIIKCRNEFVKFLKLKNKEEQNTFVCYGRLGSVLHIVLLFCLIPVTIMFVFVKYVERWVGRMSGKETNDPEFVQKLQEWVMQKGKNLNPNGSDELVMLISGAHFGKTLTIIRSIKTVKPDAKIILTDSPKYFLNGARFSRHCDVFEVVNADPETNREVYAQEMFKIALKYDVTGFLSVSKPNGAMGDALACEVIAKNCRKFNRSYHVSAELCSVLDDKHLFCELCAKLGLPAPKSVALFSEEQTLKLNLKLSESGTEELPMIIKNLSYDALHRLDLFTLPAPVDKLVAYLDKIRNDGNPITASEPWIAQTKLIGKEYSAAIVIRNGEIRLLTVSPSSASQLQFEHVSHEKIESWVQKFVSRFNKEKEATGGGLQNCQICIDFIEVESSSLASSGGIGSDIGKGQTEVYPIECNCRIHSQFSVFSTNEEGRAFLGSALLGADSSKVMYPLDYRNNKHDNKNGLCAESSSVSSSPISMSSIATRVAGKTFHFADELFKYLRIPNYGHQRLAPLSIFGGVMRDADLDLSDPLPFFCKIHLQLTSLLIHNFVSGKCWKKIDFCIGKVVELDGD